MRLLLGLLAALAVVGVLAGTALAQQIDTVSAPLFPDRSSQEIGALNRFSMDRQPQGGRSRAMGGTGLALPGGPETHAQNPAAILGLERPELGAGATFYTGSAGINSYPSELDVGTDEPLRASNYRINPRESLGYNGIFFGLPLALFGNRGAVALSYRRVGLTGFQDESRTDLQGAITNQAQAIYGVEDNPDKGMDAISFTLARKVTPQLDLGFNVNWEGGTLSREGKTGISVVGNVFAEGSNSYNQEVKALSIDGGGLLDLGRLRLGGTVYVAHDLKFHTGGTRNLTIASPPDFTRQLLVNGVPHDHTLSVPTMLGIGASYDVNERLTVAADFLYRPWSNAEVTRTRIEPFMGFTESNGETSFVSVLVPGDNEALWNAMPGLIAGGFRGDPAALSDPSMREETFNARLHDTHSLRLGLEYFLKKSESFDFPVRVGFRHENLTFNNVAAPTLALKDTTQGNEGVLSGDGMYGASIEAYRKILQGDSQCDSEDCQKLEKFLLDALEHDHMAFQGDPVGASTVTLGFGVRISEWSADFTIERTGFEFDRFFLSPFDPLLNPTVPVTHENRSLMNFTASMSMRF